MKKLVVASLLSLLAVTTVSARQFRGDCDSCPSAATVHEGTNCEPRPACYKMVRKECPARKICRTDCRYICPNDTIREENGDEG